MEHAISARGLRRSYGRGKSSFEAVKGVDLDVDEGQIFALLGTNGAGKTSTLDLLEGLAVPDSGQVHVFGLDPRRDRKQLRPQVGIMLQSGGLPGELTISETLQMWRGTCSNPTTVDSVLAATRLVQRAGVRVGQLSGGERRRVDLACALLGQPRVLFLDEPTTGLDPESRRATWQLLRELNEQGMTMVLTTHYLDEAEELADQIAIMNEGIVARRGTLREIVSDHPATIEVDNPGATAPPLPALSGATVETGAQLIIKTHQLQTHLFELLAWARDHRLELTGLDAHHASLESVFLDIAEDQSLNPPDDSGRTSAAPTPENIGAMQ